MEERQAQLLRRAFLIGAVTDGLVLVPMLVPPAAHLLWGFSDLSGTYRFTAPTWGLQLVLLSLFASAYPYPALKRRAAA